MSGAEFLEQLKEAFPDSQVTVGSKDRIWVSMRPEALLSAVKTLREHLGLAHLAVIVGEDVRDAFQLNYIFANAPVVILQVRISREAPEVPSLTGIMPGSAVYERELHDLFGIVAVGNPDLRRQSVPEDWPAGIYPLRKDVQFNRDGEVVKAEAK